MSPRRLLAAFLGLALLAFSPASLATAAPTSAFIPQDNDAYARLVAQAEADDPATDFIALRRAWLDSAARKRAASTHELTQQMEAAVQAGDHAKVRDMARKIVAINYIDMQAHKYLRQSCKLMGDEACSTHHHFVQFGLLKSIVEHGDGRSFATAWKVVSISEEYFILRMVGWRVSRQSLVSEGGVPYDVLEVTTEEGETRKVYFDISAFFGREFS